MVYRNIYIEGLSYQLPHPFRADADRVTAMYNTHAYKDQNGVIRWKSNDRVPPQDILDFWKHIGKRFNMRKAVAARNREDKIALENYRRNQKPPTAEQINEMRAAFGPGETVVDVISGRKIKL